MYSFVHNGMVLDFSFKPINDFTYAFRTGNILHGTIYRMSRKRWSAVTMFPEAAPFGVVNGFRSRHDAAEFLLQINKPFL